MPEKTCFHCPEYLCRKSFTSDGWRFKHIKLNHAEHIQVAHQKNLTFHSAPQQIEPTQHHQFNSSNDSVQDLDVFTYLEHLEIIAVFESQPPPPPLPLTEPYPGAGALLIDYIAEP